MCRRTTQTPTCRLLYYYSTITALLQLLPSPLTVVLNITKLKVKPNLTRLTRYSRKIQIDEEINTTYWKMVVFLAAFHSHSSRQKCTGQCTRIIFSRRASADHSAQSSLLLGFHTEQPNKQTTSTANFLCINTTTGGEKPVFV